MSGAAQEEGRLGDVLHKEFEIECKLRQKLSIYPWFKKNEEHAKATKKTPILVVREKGARNGDLVVIKLQDFMRVYGYAKAHGLNLDTMRLEDYD